jgi:hypothetical protein
MKTLMIVVVLYFHSASVSNIEFSNHDACVAATPIIEKSIKEKFSASAWMQPEVKISCEDVRKE